MAQITTCVFHVGELKSTFLKSTEKVVSFRIEQELYYPVKSKDEAEMSQFIIVEDQPTVS